MIASNGYVLIRVGNGHHLSDIRGYAYEHRIIAERKLKRKLKPNEIVHHKNGIKKDNRPENIEIVNNNAEHYLYHRKYHDLRKPNEKNVTI